MKLSYNRFEAGIIFILEFRYTHMVAVDSYWCVAGKDG